MIEYRIDKETPDYITITGSCLVSIATSEKKEEWPNKKLCWEALRMFKQMIDFEFECNEKKKTFGLNNHSFVKYKIHKDSVLGNFLIENNGQYGIIDYTEYISFQDIQNAYLISSFMNDAKLTNKILTLFQNQCYGFKKDLLKEYPYYETALDFILENKDFEKYLAKVNQEEIEEEAKQEPFIVYEDGEWTIKSPQAEFVRVPKKETI